MVAYNKDGATNHLGGFFFTSIPSFGHDVHRVICYQCASFSKVFGRISGDNSLCIFNLKASWDTKLFSYFNFYSLYNIRKDQLYRISGSEFHDWLLGTEKLSGLSRNGPQHMTKVNIFKCFTTEQSSARKKLAQVEFALGIFNWQETLKYIRQPKIEFPVPSQHPSLIGTCHESVPPKFVSIRSETLHLQSFPSKCNYEALGHIEEAIGEKASLESDVHWLKKLLWGSLSSF